MSNIDITERYATVGGYKKVFFIGVGGVSMSTLALMAAARGIEVSGSDRSESDMTRRLTLAGICVHIGHDAANIAGSDAVVYTAAVKADNPELAAAHERGLPCIRRAEYLGWLMSAFPVRIGVAGMHGKSTATSMLTHIWLAAGLDPSVAVGADLSAIGGACRIGGGDGFLFEACEYTDSFLSFCPTTAVVLNIEMDHPDYFRDLAQIKSSFRRYIALADMAVVNWENVNVREVCGGYGGRLVRVGDGGDFGAVNVSFERGCARFDLAAEGSVIAAGIRLAVAGAHNLTDALIASAAAYVNGVPPEAIKAGLEGFGGVHRRFEYRGTVRGARLYDDYAHHPSEIKATLTAARELTDGRIICVFQPHTYSRTAELFDDFAAALSMADMTLLADIYAARETNTYGVSSAALAEHIAGARSFDSFDAIADFLRGELRTGYMLITMGAGDVYKVGDILLADK